ncbi:UNVERIFIED_CONTAM: hypothetical protein Slati_2117600 [Sesamum latifolium]|uniref:Uncharacterized protein n=1 Tax=Sesamum latifolium TaxID=2727402 RepID=A0AAW2WQ69_9LAMI
MTGSSSSTPTGSNNSSKDMIFSRVRYRDTPDNYSLPTLLLRRFMLCWEDFLGVLLLTATSRCSMSRVGPTQPRTG